jgi:hypothetical protein
MPTAVEHSVKPLERTAAPDLSVDVTGMSSHVPAVQHDQTNPALTLNFALAGDVNGGALHLDIELLVPAVQHTDFILG